MPRHRSVVVFNEVLHDTSADASFLHVLVAVWKSENVSENIRYRAWGHPHKGGIVAIDAMPELEWLRSELRLTDEQFSMQPMAIPSVDGIVVSAGGENSVLQCAGCRPKAQQPSGNNHHAPLSPPSGRVDDACSRVLLQRRRAHPRGCYTLVLHRGKGSVCKPGASD
jgi:hypothetical protein